MRIANRLSSLFSPLVLLLGLTCASISCAQAVAPASPPAASGTPNAAAPTVIRGEKRGQTIRIEDAGAAIDEVRLGGETQSITVQPKGGMPRYEVLPANKGAGGAAGGTRVWKVLGF